MLTGAFCCRGATSGNRMASEDIFPRIAEIPNLTRLARKDTLIQPHTGTLTRKPTCNLEEFKMANFRQASCVFQRLLAYVCKDIGWYEIARVDKLFTFDKLTTP